MVDLNTVTIRIVAESLTPVNQIRFSKPIL